MGDGVILNSLDFILGDQINRLAVVRPRLTDAERESALAKLNGYMGRPYDLAFNFKDDTRLCCTEVHHHIFNGRGGVRFKLVRRMGLVTLCPDDILAQTVTSDTSGTDLVLVVDAKGGRKKNEAVVLVGSEATKRIRKLLRMDTGTAWTPGRP